MKKISRELKKILIFTIVTIVGSTGYYIYCLMAYEKVPERETFWSELGEGFGEVGLWLLIFIYLRTALKLVLGKGALSRRLIPDYETSLNPNYFQQIIRYLDKTHIYFGIGTVAVVVLHIAFMGIPMHILFFPAVLALVLWQGIFGMFISWKYSPRELKKFSFLVHAQLFTGILIGVFAYLGHLLVDD